MNQNIEHFTKISENGNISQQSANFIVLERHEGRTAYNHPVSSKFEYLF